MKKGGLTHFDDAGRARMVDVSDKPDTVRTATASGSVWMEPSTFARIVDRTIEKGDVLAVARLAGIMAAKKTPDLIPLCHPIPIDSVEITFAEFPAESRLEITATARVNGRTGIEMEVMTAVSVAALTVYDMCKAVDRSMVLGDIKLMAKDGGRWGRFLRKKADRKG